MPPTRKYYQERIDEATRKIKLIKRGMKNAKPGLMKRVMVQHENYLAEWKRKEERAVERLREFLNREAEREVRKKLMRMVDDSHAREANQNKVAKRIRHIRRIEEDTARAKELQARKDEVKREGLWFCECMEEPEDFQHQDEDEEQLENDEIEADLQEIFMEYDRLRDQQEQERQGEMNLDERVHVDQRDLDMPILVD